MGKGLMLQNLANGWKERRESIDKVTSGSRRKKKKWASTQNSILDIPAPPLSCDVRILTPKGGRGGCEAREICVR